MNFSGTNSGDMHSRKITAWMISAAVILMTVLQMMPAKCLAGDIEGKEAEESLSDSGVSADTVSYGTISFDNVSGSVSAADIRIDTGRSASEGVSGDTASVSIDAVSVIPADVPQDAYDYNDTAWQLEWDYELSGNRIRLKAYTGSSDDIVIPQKAVIGNVSYNTMINGNVFPENVRCVTICSGTESEDLSGMFSGCRYLERTDIGRMSLSGCTAADNMFSGCSMLTCIDMSSLDFAGIMSAGNMFCRAVREIVTPANLSVKAELPESFYYEFDAGRTKIYTELPQNLAYSVRLRTVPKQLEATVPVSMTIAVDCDGSLISPDNYSIINTGNVGFYVNSVRAEAQEGFFLGNSTGNNTFCADMTAAGHAERLGKTQMLERGVWDVASGQQLPIKIYGSAGNFTEDITKSRHAFNIFYTIKAGNDAADSARRKHFVTVNRNTLVSSVSGSGLYFEGDRVTLCGTAGYGGVGAIWVCGSHNVLIPSGNEKKPVLTFIMPDEDVVMSYAAGAATHRVEFDAGEKGTLIGEAEKIVKYNENYGNLPEAVRTGYDFSGWKTSDGSVITDSTCVSTTDDEKLTAEWQARNDTAYTVIHQEEALDGTYVTVKKEVLTGTSDAAVKPQVSGYEGFTAPEPEQMTIEADGSGLLTYRYTRNSYDVILEKDEHVHSVSGGGKYKYGENVSLSMNVTQAGYRPGDWTGDETDAAFAMPAKDITVSANSEAIIYKITYELNGGMNSASNPSFYTAEDEIILAEPTFTLTLGFGGAYYNKTFTGWTGSNGGTADSSLKIEKGTTGDLYYSANWYSKCIAMTTSSLYSSMGTYANNYLVVFSNSSNPITCFSSAQEALSYEDRTDVMCNYYTKLWFGGGYFWVGNQQSKGGWWDTVGFNNPYGWVLIYLK